MANEIKGLEKRNGVGERQEKRIFFSPQFQNMLQFQVKNTHIYLAYCFKNFCCKVTPFTLKIPMIEKSNLLIFTSFVFKQILAFI